MIIIPINIKIIFLLFFAYTSVLHAETSKISGYVYESYSNEQLMGVNIYLDGRYKKNTDKNGYFEFNNIMPGKHHLKVTFIGYYNEEREIEVDRRQKEYKLNFRLNYGPQFAKSIKFNAYHNKLRNLHINNNSCFRIEPKSIEKRNFDITINFVFVNDSDESIFVTKYNFGIYISDSLGSVIQWVPQYVVSLDHFYKENDVIEIKEKSKFTHSCLIPYNDKIIFQYLQEYKYVVLEYYFDIEAPVCTTGAFEKFPSGDDYRKLENIYCKLFRMPVKSKPFKLKYIK